MDYNDLIADAKSMGLSNMDAQAHANGVPYSDLIDADDAQDVEDIQQAERLEEKHYE